MIIFTYSSINFIIFISFDTWFVRCDKLIEEFKKLIQKWCHFLLENFIFFLNIKVNIEQLIIKFIGMLSFYLIFLCKCQQSIIETQINIGNKFITLEYRYLNNLRLGSLWKWICIFKNTLKVVNFFPKGKIFDKLPKAS